MKSGCVISFSGIDGSGKTTQIDTLINKLKQTNHSWKYVYFRIGFTKRIKHLKKKMNIQSNQIISTLEQKTAHPKKKKKLARRVYDFLSLTDLIITYFTIHWYWFRNFIVIVDRNYWDNYVIYLQSNPDEQINKQILWRFAQWIAGSPDVAFFLKISPEEAHQRIVLRGYDTADLRIIEERVALYEKLESQANWYIIAADISKNQISDEIWAEVKRHIPSAD